MKTVKTKAPQAPKPRFEFITVSAPGEEIGGVLVDNLHAHEEHANPVIIVPFGWYGTRFIRVALNRAARAVSGATGSTVCEAALRHEIAVTGTLAVEWQETLNAICEWEAAEWEKAGEQALEDFT